MNLTQMQAGGFGVVTRVSGDARFLNRVTGIGLTKGVRFQLVRNDGKMPVLLYCRETLIALNRPDAQRIKVRAE